jgi:hypothetical protein
VKRGACIGALLCFWIAPACLSAELLSERNQHRLSDVSIDALQPGTSLQTCIDSLGAPLSVAEFFDGMALSYGWFLSVTWGASISIPFSADVSGSLSYTDRNERLHGVMLLFDADWRLTEIRRGNLRDLQGTITSQPPQPIEDDDEDDEDDD